MCVNIYKYICAYVYIYTIWQYQVLTRMQSKWNSHAFLEGRQNGTVATLETVGHFPERVNVHLEYDPVISHLGIFPRKMKTHIPTKPVCECSLQPLKSGNPQISSKKWRDEHMEVPPYHGPPSIGGPAIYRSRPDTHKGVDGPPSHDDG